MSEAEKKSGSPVVRWLLAPLWIPLVFLLVLLLVGFLVMLLPVVLIIGLVKCIRRAGAEGKIGKVSVDVGAEQLGQEEKKKGKIRQSCGILAKLKRIFQSLEIFNFLAAPGKKIPVAQPLQAI